MDTQQYLQAHNLELLFKELLAVILIHKPADPIDFMIHSLSSLKSSSTSSTSGGNLTEFFKGSIATYNPSCSSSNQIAPIPEDSFPLQMPRFNRLRRGSVSSESLVPSRSPLPIPFHPKSDESRARILSSIQGNILFKSLEPDQLHEIVGAMLQVVVPAGITIIRQGEDGDNFYVVESGAFDICIGGTKVLSVGHGGSFGELALLYNTPRAATVTATQDSQLWALDRITFRRLLANNIFKKRTLYESFLRSVPIFESLSGEEISRIADALELCEFVQGSEIIKQGTAGDKFYILVEGEAEVTIATENTNSEGGKSVRKAGRIGPGDYFGEIAMLTNAPRVATVRCVSAVAKCISLEAGAFTRLLGPIREVLKRNMEHYKKYEGYIQ